MTAGPPEPCEQLSTGGRAWVPPVEMFPRARPARALGMYMRFPFRCQRVIRDPNEKTLVGRISRAAALENPSAAPAAPAASGSAWPQRSQSGGRPWYGNQTTEGDCTSSAGRL